MKRHSPSRRATIRRPAWSTYRQVLALLMHGAAVRVGGRVGGRVAPAVGTILSAANQGIGHRRGAQHLGHVGSGGGELRDSLCGRQCRLSGRVPHTNRNPRRQRRTAVSTYIATLNDTVIARSDQTVLIEGNRYFPLDSVREEHFTRTRMKSLCPWKGVASYYTVTVAGGEHRNAAWTYRHPSPLARKIKNHMAFWGLISVTEE